MYDISCMYIVGYMCGYVIYNVYYIVYYCGFMYCCLMVLYGYIVLC
nr:MAG TPA: hypothetical protein [Caudoviricetes sp.]